MFFIHVPGLEVITGKGGTSAQLRTFLSRLNERVRYGFDILKALVSAFVRYAHLNTCTSLFLQQRF